MWSTSPEKSTYYAGNMLAIYMVAMATMYVTMLHRLKEEHFENVIHVHKCMSLKNDLLD